MATLLSINNYYYRRGGAEVVFLEQNRLFEEIGWTVVPFAMKHNQNYESKWSEYFVEELEFGESYSAIEKLARVPKVIYSFEAQQKIRALIDKIQPQVCHAHNIYHHISPSILSVLKKQRVPTVLTLHDLKIACPAYSMMAHDGICERCKGGKLYNVLKHKCIKNSAALSSMVMLESYLHQWLGSYKNNVDRIVVPSKFYIEKLVEWGWNRERFVHVPNFVDVNSHQPDFTAGGGYVYFGRLGKEKGLETLIRAAATAKQSLRIVGTGPHEAILKQLANELNAEVEFLGYQTGEALHNAIRASRAMVLPSEWYENAPMSVMESYALGTPVIGADIGGIPELIRVNETGTTFTSGSITELANAMTALSEMADSTVSEMGKLARTWMEQEFTAERYRERLVNLYAEMGAN